jgi:hypothetical protein
MSAPWDSEPTSPTSSPAVEAWRAEQKLEEERRQRALALMDDRGIQTFAEALEMVREGRA